MWSGSFGDSYIDRNRSAGRTWGEFWTEFLRSYPVSSVLEVGSSIGLNLDWIVSAVPGPVVGVDISPTALAEMQRRLPSVQAVLASARDLPLPSGSFDLVFTATVLIHQPPGALEEVMREVVRCSRRYVLCIEYFAPTFTEVPYRGQPGSLFKLDFGAKYQELFPTLRQIFRRDLPREIFDEERTAWLFELS